MREAKSPGCREGKIKGTARDRLPSPSARGFGTALRVGRVVPFRGRTRPEGKSERVPSPIHCAPPRWNSHYGRT